MGTGTHGLSHTRHRSVTCLPRPCSPQALSSWRCLARAVGGGGCPCGATEGPGRGHVQEGCFTPEPALPSSIQPHEVLGSLPQLPAVGARLRPGFGLTAPAQVDMAGKGSRKALGSMWSCGSGETVETGLLQARHPGSFIVWSRVALQTLAPGAASPTAFSSVVSLFGSPQLLADLLADLLALLHHPEVVGIPPTATVDEWLAGPCGRVVGIVMEESPAWATHRREMTDVT